MKRKCPGGGATRPLPRDGGVEELHGDPTVRLRKGLDQRSKIKEVVPKSSMNGESSISGKALHDRKVQHDRGPIGNLATRVERESERSQIFQEDFGWKTLGLWRGG